MEEIAWMLVTKKTGRDIGFVNPDTWQRMKEKKDNEPPR
jgi:hypothetical protein